MEKTTMSRSQKRNMRRKKNKNHPKVDENNDYNLGDAIQFNYYDITNLGENYTLSLKGFIVKRVEQKYSSSPRYVVRLELLQEIKNFPDYLLEKVFPEAKDNCSFSRKRYEKEEFEKLILYFSFAKKDNIEEFARDFYDYVIIDRDDIYSHFPLSKYRPTVEQCLYQTWMEDQITSVGVLSLITDKTEIERWCLDNRFKWNFYNDLRFPDKLIKITCIIGCKKLVEKKITTFICPDFLQQSDLKDFHENFETSTGNPYMNKASLPKTGNMVMCNFKFNREGMPEIDKWKIISKDVFDVYNYILLLRSKIKIEKKDLMGGKYFDCIYKELPKDVKIVFDSLMWPRDRIFKVVDSDSNSFVSKKLVEIDTA